MKSSKRTPTSSPSSRSPSSTKETAARTTSSPDAAALTGRNCVHVLGAYMRSGVLELPSRMPRLARNQNQRGKLPNAKKMSRFYKVYLHNLLNVLFLPYYFITLPYYFITLPYCLRSRPVSPNVVRLFVRDNVENSDRVTE